MRAELKCEMTVTQTAAGVEVKMLHITSTVGECAAMRH